MSNFYTRPDNFPPVVKNLIIINAIIFFAQMSFGENSFTDENLFALHDIHSVYFKPYQLLTYMFMHGGFTHLLFNMFALWMFGKTLENHWGPKRFLIFYILCGLGAAVCHLIVLYFQMEPVMEVFRILPIEQQLELVNDPHFKVNVPTVGASGSIFGCLAGFAFLFPNSIIYINLLFPIKAKWYALIFGVLELTMGINNSAGDNVAHFAHLGGALTAVIIIFIWNKTNRKTLY